MHKFFTTVALVLGGGTLVALVIRWWQTLLASGLLGLDLAAYRAAAERLRATGTPYSAELLAGPIANTVENVEIGYLYPPPLAQLFLLAPDGTWVTFVWVAGQVAAMAGASWALGRRVGVAGPVPWVAWALATIAFYPVHMAAFIGNVSGWLAAMVALVLVLAPGPRGLVAAAAGILKGSSFPLMLAAAAVRRGRVAAITGGAALVAVSATLHPGAWEDWVRIIPHLAGMTPGGAPANVAPAAVLAGTVLAPLGEPLRVGALAAALVSSCVLGWRGRDRGAMAAAVCAVLLIGTTTWDHHVAMLGPVLALAWRHAGRGRLLISGALAGQLVWWLQLAEVDLLFAGSVGLMWAAAIVAVFTLAREDTARSARLEGLEAARS